MNLYVPADQIASTIQLHPVDNLLEKILVMDHTLSEKPEDRFVWTWSNGDNEYVTTLAYDEWSEWDVEQRSSFVHALACIGHKAGIT